VERTLLGRPVLTTGLIPSQSLRPVTLVSEDGQAWMARADLLVLHGWAQDAPESRVMALALHDGRMFRVRFRLWDAPVIQAEPLVPMSDPGDADRYVLRELRLGVA